MVFPTWSSPECADAVVHTPGRPGIVVFFLASGVDARQSTVLCVRITIATAEFDLDVHDFNDDGRPDWV